MAEGLANDLRPGTGRLSHSTGQIAGYAQNSYGERSGFVTLRIRIRVSL